MPVSAEGRVEHQKLNQVEAPLLPRWVFGVQLDYSCRKKSVPPDAENRVVWIFLSYLLLNAARYLVISIHGPAIAFTKCYGRRAYPLKRTSSLLKAVCQKQNHGDIISDETRKNHFYLTESKQGNAKFFSFFISVLTKNRGIYYIYIGIWAHVML